MSIGASIMCVRLKSHSKRTESLFEYCYDLKGKESRYSLQQRMIEDHIRTVGEARMSEIFPRVIVRWRGRLLMAENWVSFGQRHAEIE